MVKYIFYWEFFDDHNKIFMKRNKVQIRKLLLRAAK